jgi:hypothetical protein
MAKATKARGSRKSPQWSANRAVGSGSAETPGERVQDCRRPRRGTNSAVADEHETAADIARLHTYFARLHLKTYGVTYPNHLHTTPHEWSTTSDLLARHGKTAALVLIERAFADSLMSPLGVTIGLVAEYAPQLAWSPLPNGSRLDPKRARIAQAVLDEREGRSYPEHLAWLASRTPAERAAYARRGVARAG